MAMPITRPMPTRFYSIPPNMPMNRTAVGPSFNLAPSNGQRFPYGQGVMHTVKNPAQILPSPTPARVT